jgi:hypothetical protein
MKTIRAAFAGWAAPIAASFLLVMAATAHSESAPTGPTAIPAIAAGHARIWIYRDYIPSESLNMATVRINGAVTGYAQAAGGSFYRDVPPGRYLVTVDTFGRDTDQSTDLSLAPGQAAYIKIESLSSWSNYGGERTSIQRDTFYARPISPQLAQHEMAYLPYYGGS